MVSRSQLNSDEMISFNEIHAMNKRALPDSFLQYKLAIQLFKLYNTTIHSMDWTELNLNQISTSRQTTFSVLKTNKKVGLNILVNRLSILNGKIPLGWLNCSLESFKVKCKGLLLKWKCTPLHKIATTDDNDIMIDVCFNTLINNEYNVFGNWSINK